MIESTSLKRIVGLALQEYLHWTSNLQWDGLKALETLVVMF